MMKSHARYTSDAIIIHKGSDGNKFIFIERKNKPFGFALAGGFRDVLDEYLDHHLVINNDLPIPPALTSDVILEAPLVAAKREAMEETNCELFNLKLFQVRDDLHRDPRGYTISHVYYGFTESKGKAQSDAANLIFVDFDNIETFLSDNEFAFDHKEIMQDFIKSRFFKNLNDNTTSI